MRFPIARDLFGGNDLVLELNHGLGNQLSLYFAGLAYAQKFGLNLVLIGSSPINAGHKSFRDILELKLPGLFLEKNTRVPSLMTRFNQSVSFRFPKSFKFTGEYYGQLPGYDEFLLETPGISRLSGFFHTYAYFEQCKEYSPGLSAREIFPLSDLASKVAEQIQRENTVVIHIRRGDYLSNSQSLGILRSSYYSRALTTLREKTEIEHLLVFSDDHQLARETLDASGVRGFVFPEERGNLLARELVRLLSLAPNLVIANSTLSYWSAVLAEDGSKIVAPRPFYRNFGISEDYFYKPNWITLEPEYDRA